MVGEISKPGVPPALVKARSPLLPDRHPTPDFFVCDIFDAAPKGDMASMEHPIFSLSTKPDHRVRRYEHGASFVEIKPSSDGLATVHDRDILIFCISQLMRASRTSRPISQTVRFKAFDLLKATNRVTSGEGYERLKAAFERLAGTRISTNIVTGGSRGLEHVRSDRTGDDRPRDPRRPDAGSGGQTLRLGVQRHSAEGSADAAPGLFPAAEAAGTADVRVGPQALRQQNEWKISLPLLQKKCGSASTEKEFRGSSATSSMQDRPPSPPPRLRRRP